MGLLQFSRILHSSRLVKCFSQAMHLNAIEVAFMRKKKIKKKTPLSRYILNTIIRTFLQFFVEPKIEIKLINKSHL